MTTQTIQWIKNNPEFCTAPYSAYDFRFQFDKFKVTTCCNLDTIRTNKDLDFEFIESVKHDMAQGVVSPACWRCSNAEQNQAQSERIKLMLGYSVDDLIKFKTTNTTNEFQLGMKFSNLCNLACRSCNEFDSNLWSKLMNQPINIEHETDISTDEFLWNTMTDMIRVKHKENSNFIVHPIGGETLIQPGFLKLVDWLIAENLADTTILRITTNLASNLLDKFLPKFSQFRRVEILSSIDSVGDNYHYVRWPAKFTKIEENLKIFTDASLRYPNKFSLSVSPVFSLNNIFYAVDCLDWWENWADQTQTNLWLSNIHLYKPEHLMVENLSTEYYPQLIELLEKCISHNVFKKYQRTAVLREYFLAMLSTIQYTKHSTEEMFNQYLKFTADYDNRTNTDSYTLNSKLFDLLSDAHKNIYNSHLQHVQSKI